MQPLEGLGNESASEAKVFAIKSLAVGRAMVDKAFNPNTREAKAGGNLCEFEGNLVYKR